MAHPLPWRRLLIAALTAMATVSIAQPVGAQGPSQTEWIVPDGTPSSWFDADNWSRGLPSNDAYATIDHDGVAVIDDGAASARAIWLGVEGVARLRIRGGTTNVDEAVTLGSALNSRGIVDIDGGALNVTGQLYAGANDGLGLIRQSGGAVDALNLKLGGGWAFSLIYPGIDAPQNRGEGRYDMTGGTFDTFSAVVGESGVGVFRQNGGRVNVERTLRIGGLLGSQALWTEPSVDQLVTLPSLRVDGESAARSNSTQAAHAVALDSAYLNVWHPPLVPSRGRYRLESGELLGGDLLVDNTGVYRQAGGAASLDFVATRMNGRLALRGGSFHAEHGLRSDQPLRLGGGNVLLSVGAGILDLGSGISGGQNAQVTVGPDSLTIIPAGLNPEAAFGAFQSLGLLHVAGTELTLAANKRIAGAGVLSDYVDARGKISAAADHGINLSGGLRLRDAADVDLGAGGLATRGRASVVEGGVLTANQVVVGGTLNAPWEHQFQRSGYPLPREPMISSEAGALRQAAGVVEVDTTLSVLNGVYRMSGGELNADRMDVGVNQFLPSGGSPIEARFVQTGGIVRTPSLGLSQTYLYPLVVFRQTDGVFPRVAQGGATPLVDAPLVAAHVIADSMTSHLVVPVLSPAVDATYRIEGGQLLTSTIYMGGSYDRSAGRSRFVQTGGNVEATSGISMYGATASYVIAGGALKTHRLKLGADYILSSSEYPDYVPSDSATFAIRNADADITIAGQFTLGGGSHFRAVPGSTIRMIDPTMQPEYWPALSSSLFQNFSTNSEELSGLRNLTFLFEGQTERASPFEVAGADLGDIASGFAHNFALGNLTIGGAAGSAWVRLVDQADNQRDGFLSEALYVDTLVVAAGSTLDLGGLNLYYRHATIAGAIIAENGAAMRLAIPEPAALALVVAAAAFSLPMRRWSRGPAKRAA